MKSRFFPLFALLTIASLLFSACAPGFGGNGQIVTESGEIYLDYILDCFTFDNAGTGVPIQPDSACDDLEHNFFERPFNAITQDTYFPDLDIRYGEIDFADGYFIIHMSLQGARSAETPFHGTYAAELDTDRDGRGDYLIGAVAQPGQSSDWTETGVFALEDSNNDVGGATELQPDEAADAADGYDRPLDIQRMARARFVTGAETFVEFAFKTELIGSPDSMVWWLWADEGLQQPEHFDYQDAFTPGEAGEVYDTLPAFPARSIAQVDNTCANLWGSRDFNDDPRLCRNSRIQQIVPVPAGIAFDISCDSKPDDIIAQIEQQVGGPLPPTIKLLLSLLVTMIQQFMNCPTGSDTPLLPPPVAFTCATTYEQALPWLQNVYKDQDTGNWSEADWQSLFVQFKVQTQACCPLPLEEFKWLHPEIADPNELLAAYESHLAICQETTSYGVGIAYVCGDGQITWTVSNSSDQEAMLKWVYYYEEDGQIVNTPMVTEILPGMSSQQYVTELKPQPLFYGTYTLNGQSTKFSLPATECELPELPGEPKKLEIVPGVCANGTVTWSVHNPNNEDAVIKWTIFYNDEGVVKSLSTTQEFLAGNATKIFDSEARPGSIFYGTYAIGNSLFQKFSVPLPDCPAGGTGENVEPPATGTIEVQVSCLYDSTNAWYLKNTGATEVTIPWEFDYHNANQQDVEGQITLPANSSFTQVYTSPNLGIFMVPGILNRSSVTCFQPTPTSTPEVSVTPCVQPPDPGPSYSWNPALCTWYYSGPK